MYYTIYKITNVLDGKFYIGKHKTKNLDDGYMGSGKLIQRAIKKHGVENFKKEILHIFETEAEMNEAEKRLVILSEDSYNLCPGGHGGFGYINSNNLNNKNHDTEIANNKRSAFMKEFIKKPGAREKLLTELRRAHKEGKLAHTHVGNRGLVDENMRRKASSPDAIEKRKQTYKTTDHQKGEKNSQFGRPKSEETKQKIRESLAKTRALKSLQGNY